MSKLFGHKNEDATSPSEETIVETKSEASSGVVHANIEEMDADLRELYRDARSAAVEAQAESGDKRNRFVTMRSPFVLGFTITLGVLVAILVGDMFGQLSTIIMYVVAALFIALGLDPVVRKFEKRGMKRPVGIAVVFLGFIAIIATILAIVIPMIAHQVNLLIQSAPELVTDITSKAWYKDINERFGQYIDFQALLKSGQDLISKPENWTQVAGGVWQAGMGIANGLTAALIILILSLYFLSSMRSIKRGFYTLVPRSGRAKVIDITEQVAGSVGGYVNGMVLLALMNSILGFIMMLIVGVPFAGLVAVGVFILALIPLIGSVMATVLVGIVALFNSPMTALVAVIYYLVYMQIESYVFTPRIMNRVVAVPGALVVIGALAGGTLLGLLGALISIPVTASILMIIKQVWVPRQETR
ncbi:AI-2E family transporter [Leucobacter sp. cx-328]|uniref:AI-2E family transporter n=1 Tax=unclassified Leucobacter TaxID=2621730 RepID=UPI00165E5061|nr:MULTISPECIES: AI-2E family transporter [unclassified Leucobacter]MBC9944396.1 AI-2E family transporter [Leucobacter sp. cx-328]